MLGAADWAAAGAAAWAAGVVAGGRCAVDVEDVVSQAMPSSSASRPER
ncbi:hypothetical protein [Frankia sp. AvcI1]|nr:hypothetical protein [Frankia sp. AvcI1]